MAKVLIPVGENELKGTNGRLLYMARAMAMKGIVVDVLTYSRSVYDFSVELNKGITAVRNNLISPNPIHIDHIASLVNTFIKLTYDMYIPGTDIKLYKVTAFDDFRGHVATFTYPGMDITSYDAVMLPIPSTEVPPLADCDIFYSTMCFYAKEQGVPVVGIQMFPAIQTPPIFLRVIDYIVIKYEWEKEYLKEYGFDLSKAFILDYEQEAYYIDTIEDKYMDSLLNPSINLPKEELVILLINHPRLRFCVKEALEVINELTMPKTVFFMKRKFVIRELSEDDIINDFFMTDIKKIKGRSFIMEPDSKGDLIMLCDVLISPAYLTTLGFASEYGKLSIVYNPVYEKKDFQRDVAFVNNKESLKTALSGCYKNKQAKMSFPDIVKGIIRDRKKISQGSGNRK
ncbi:hypothetical protein [Candidatus Magnetominusculus xianensis]|uniref:Uncharacterized protein n=1 Tax=Candidatus Magnetominusculus xianensis TaxID=1748249 RepID=A0ABR5SF64_9BACT|nr:hypothetical protein [Candidatus Magnetominusculus xianensis]KWT84069.1 hypothetical protein ASN18_1996 [Candidatus Magnetominusculus xianensis]MBF0402362.1 hypothetical protein [Nitrospirota bacterium]